MDKNFKAEKVSRTATFEINANINKVFPLFGAFEERKWADGWNPTLIYPSTEIIEEGTVFKTKGDRDDEKEFIWFVSKYEPQNYLIQYVVSTQNRFWTITIKCKIISDTLCAATVVYKYIGLNPLGNEINKHSLEKMYAEDLKDWQAAINFYLTNGEVLKTS